MVVHTEILKIEDLAKILKDRRDTKGIGLRVAAGEAGVSFNTFARVEKGHVPDIETFGSSGALGRPFPGGLPRAGKHHIRFDPGSDRDPLAWRPCALLRCRGTNRRDCARVLRPVRKAHGGRDCLSPPCGFYIQARSICSFRRAFTGNARRSLRRRGLTCGPSSWIQS